MNKKFFNFIFFLCIVPNIVIAANFEVKKCINISNALEAPKEGEWGVIIKDYFFEDIKFAGFDTVRLPIRWDVHFDSINNKISGKFLNRVKSVVNSALNNNLSIIIDVHHFSELNKNPDKETMKIFKEIWSNISFEFSKYDERLMFEILNEPNGKINHTLYQSLVEDVIKIIRVNNKNRIIIVGGSSWTTAESLMKMNFSNFNDSNVISTFHYYKPLSFTHQKQDWIKFKDVGKFSYLDLIEMRIKLSNVSSWSIKHDIPVLLGEFGVSKYADKKERLEWLKAIVDLTDTLNIPWCIWGLSAGFGIYDSSSREFDKDVINVLFD